MGYLYDAGLKLAQDNILTAGELAELTSQALENQKFYQSEFNDMEKLADEFGTPAAKLALPEIKKLLGAFPGNLDGEIHGITDTEAAKLEMGGALTAADLLHLTRTPEGRDKLAQGADINKTTLLGFAECTDLARVIGIGPKYAALLNGVGINNMRELGIQDTEKLREQIKAFMATPEGEKITKRCPSKPTVSSWILAARLLPDAIRYAGDVGPNFTMEAFEALPNDQKALLIRGRDVPVGTSSVFETSGLTETTPTTKPALIADWISQVEHSAFDGDYEEAQLSNIRVVSLSESEEDILGYVLEFEVSSSEGGFEYEGTEMGGLEGTVEVTLENDGQMLLRWDDTWPADDWY